MGYFAGVDGGGTKTAVLCIDEYGNDATSAVFGPFNINSVGRDGLRRVMEEILIFLHGQGKCLKLCIGAAGNGNAALREEIAAAMALSPDISYELVGDYEIARYGALGGRPGLALVAGTGAVCSGINAEGKTLRVGGWGPLIGDGGSGYAIGRDALHELTLMRDGMAPRGLMCCLLEEKFDLTTRENIVGRVYGLDKSATAAVSICALEAAEKGDEAAIRILRANAAELAALARAVVDRLSMSSPDIALLGSLVRKDNFYRRLVSEAMESAVPGIHCVEPVYSPDRGAALMAKAEWEGNCG